MKKKILLLGFSICMLVGCSIINTPTAKVEDLLTMYQKGNNTIKDEIERVLDEQNLTEEHKERYRKVLNKQYESLTYEIKDELIDGDNATVVVEIEVVDYKKAINDLLFDSSIYTKESFDEEKLSRLENAKEKVKYTLEIKLTKDNNSNEWKMDALTNEQIKKIQGMY